MQIVLNIIAIMGFGLSLFNFFLGLWKSRSKLCIEITNVFSLNFDNETPEIINLRIYNDSSAPINISQIIVSNGSVESSFGLYRRKILSKNYKHNNIIDKSENWYSCALPVHLEGKGVISGLFSADDYKKCVFNSDGPYFITICSNKNRSRHKINSISISEDSKLIEKCQLPE